MKIHRVDDLERMRELRRAETAYRRNSERVEASKLARNQAVWRAIADGWSYSEIADHAGLSRQRVAQISKLDPNYRPRRRPKPKA